MNFRERIEQAREKQNDPLAANNNEFDENGFESEYFGIDNIKSFPACLDLRLQDGKRLALPYSYIQEMVYSADGQIELASTNKIVKIDGRYLGKLFDYLTAYRVRYITEHTGSDNKEEGLFVKEITISEKY